MGKIECLRGVSDYSEDIASPVSLLHTNRKPTPVEKYEQVDPSKLSIDFQADIPGEVRWDAEGNITAFGGGKVTRFTVGGKPIELVSDDMLLEEKEVFIVTKDYGKIKVTFNSNFTISLWLKPSQKAEILELIK